jgi:hypothetical protein
MALAHSHLHTDSAAAPSWRQALKTLKTIWGIRLTMDASQQTTG